jgi:hypothetical protein
MCSRSRASKSISTVIICGTSRLTKSHSQKPDVEIEELNLCKVKENDSKRPRKLEFFLAQCENGVGVLCGASGVNIALGPVEIRSGFFCRFIKEAIVMEAITAEIKFL